MGVYERIRRPLELDAFTYLVSADVADVKNAHAFHRLGSLPCKLLSVFFDLLYECITDLGAYNTAAAVTHAMRTDINMRFIVEPGFWLLEQSV